MPRRRFIAVVTLFAAAFAAGCASDERPADLRSLGEKACLEHGGLATIDKIGEHAIYYCYSGMSFELSTPPAALQQQPQQ